MAVAGLGTKSGSSGVSMVLHNPANGGPVSLHYVTNQGGVANMGSTFVPQASGTTAPATITSTTINYAITGNSCGAGVLNYTNNAPAGCSASNVCYITVAIASTAGANCNTITHTVISTTNNSAKTLTGAAHNSNTTACARTQDTSTEPANITSPTWAVCTCGTSGCTLSTQTVTSLSSKHDLADLK